MDFPHTLLTIETFQYVPYCVYSFSLSVSKGVFSSALNGIDDVPAVIKEMYKKKLIKFRFPLYPPARNTIVCPSVFQKRFVNITYSATKTSQGCEPCIMIRSILRYRHRQIKETALQKHSGSLKRITKKNYRTEYFHAVLRYPVQRLLPFKRFSQQISIIIHKDIIAACQRFIAYIFHQQFQMVRHPYIILVAESYKLTTA